MIDTGNLREKLIRVPPDLIIIMMSYDKAVEICGEINNERANILTADPVCVCQLSRSLLGSK